ncbi:hypothetical protein BAAM0483_05020 [Bifidobacterium animalis subsp. animalis MCC 0483]|uniref:MFS transporter n=1 Tax=Bifidobacterium animalis subsp. animalis MCC 0483 TaxID=1365955 RepID=A0AB34T8V4_9BIFI|nr:hypothetical protein [Bifidobacterium animalis]KOA49509.1 hypothetical protein BAAM0483_05020 [Bifidobacterium animalis subsp. animalis MCC 0483]
MALEKLPVLRWSDVATTLENRTDGLIDYITNLFKAVPLNVEGMFLSMGNGLWSAGAKLLQQSSGAEAGVVSKMGAASNKIVGSFYTGLTGDWVIPGMITVFVCIAGIFAVFRGQGAMVLLKRIMAFACGIALFLSIGAISAAHPNQAATGTPWWAVNLTRSIVGNTGNILDRSLRTGMTANGTLLAKEKDAGNDANANWLDCRKYLYQLNQEASADSKDSLGDTMNLMWEETGLRMWVRAQYGPGENGSNVFCRVLESRAVASPEDQAARVQRAIGAAQGHKERDGTGKAEGPISPDGLAFHSDLMFAASDDDGKTAATNVMNDRMTTMWDTCRYNNQGWSVRSGWNWIDWVQGSGRGLDADSPKGHMAEYCQIVMTGSTNGELSWAKKDENKGNWRVYDHNAQHDDDKLRITAKKGSPQTNQNMRQVVEKFNLSNKDTAWIGDAKRYTATLGDPKDRAQADAALATVKQQHGDANLADVGGSLVFALAGLVNFLIWGVGVGVMRLLAVIMACVAAIGVWLGFIVWAVCPDKGRRTLKDSSLNMLGMCALTSMIGVFASLVCMIMNVFMSVFGIIDGDGNTAATVVVMGCASLLFPLLSVWVLRWMCVNVLKVGDPFSMGAFGKLSKSVGHGFTMMGGMLAAGTAAAVAGGSMKGIAQAAVSGLKSGSIGSAMAHGSIIGHNSGTGTPNVGGKGGGRHSGSRQPTAADRSINPQERQAIAENRDIAPSLDKPDMSKEQHQLDDTISQLDKKTELDARNRLTGKYKDDPAGLAQAVQQQVDAAHETNEQQAARMLAEQAARADITSMLKATGGNTSRKTIDKYMQSAAVQEQVAAKAKQSLADRASHQQALRQYENEAADYNRQKELSKTFRGRLKMTRERYQTLADDHGTTGKAAAWLATGVATAAGETARFAKHHKAAATALALPAMTALGPLGLAGVGVAGAVATGGVMNMAHRMMGGGYGKLSPRVRQADQSVRFQNRAAGGIATATDRRMQQHREDQAAGVNPFTRMSARLDRMDATLESGIGQVVTHPAQSVKSAAHRMGMAGLPEATKQVWDTPKPADSQPEPDGKPLPSTSTPILGKQPSVPSTPAVPPADGMPAPTPPIPPVASTPAGQDAMPSAPARSQAVQPPVGHPGE